MKSLFPKKDWSQVQRRALQPTEIVSQLAQLQGWTLSGEGSAVAIEKTFHFANYFETIAFVNALAMVAHAEDHHPDLAVGYNRCAVRFNTHDVQGISATDMECAARVDALLQ